MYEHILVTGGAGFVGSTLALGLKARFPTCRITALDNLKRRGSELNLARLRSGGIKFVHGDIRNVEDISLADPPGLVLECSAEPSVLAGRDGSPSYVVHTNLLGTFHCLEKIREWRSDIVFFSTSRVYPVALLNELRFEEQDCRFALSREQSLSGASEHGISEDFPMSGARSLYGMTKYCSELMLEEYADSFGVRFIVNRCGVIAGPWQMGKLDQGVIALWMAAHYFRKELSYIGFGGSGKQVRDFVHVDDLLDLLVTQLQDFDVYQGKCFNVGGGPANSVSLLEATELCHEITGNTIPIGRVVENRPNDVRIFITDARRIRKQAGWAPARNARQTFGDIYNWIRAEEASLRGTL